MIKKFYKRKKNKCLKGAILVIILSSMCLGSFGVITDNITIADGSDHNDYNYNIYVLGPFTAGNGHTAQYNYGYYVGTILRDNYYSLKLMLCAGYLINRAVDYKSDLEDFLTYDDISTNEYDFCTYFIEELEGLIDALGNNYKNSQIPTKTVAPHQCTTTVSTGEATTGDFTYLSQNFDPPPSMSAELIDLPNHFFEDTDLGLTQNLFIVDIDGFNKYVFFGVPILYEVPIVNEKGVSFCGNSLQKNHGIFNDQTVGACIWFLDKWTMMNCDDVSEVEDYWTNIRKTYDSTDLWPWYWPYTWDGEASMWSDINGDIISFEYAGNYSASEGKHQWQKIVRNSAEIPDEPIPVPVYNDILWHTNHFQWLSEDDYYGVDVPNPPAESLVREERARYLLNLDHADNPNGDGGIDFEDIYDLTRDQNDSDLDKCICRGPSKKNSSFSDTGGTFFAWITETELNKLPKVYWCEGREQGESPKYDGNWSVFDCNDYFPHIDIDQSVFDRGFPIRHAIDGDWAGAQSFIPTVGTITSCQIYIRKFGNPEFDLTVELRKDHPQGTLVESLTFPEAELPTDWEWFTVDFTDVAVTPGTEYFIVLPPAPSGVTTSFGYEWGYAFGNQYDDGSFWFTRDGGGLWRDLPTMYEFVFRTYGYSQVI